MEERNASGVRRSRENQSFVTELSKCEKSLITTFKEAIKCNLVRDNDRVFKYVNKSKRTEYKSKTEYTEITYKDLKNVINNEYLSDNIGTYYMCLLQEREYLYKKESKRCLFLNSIQFHKVKYPSYEKDHDEVKIICCRDMPLLRKRYFPKIVNYTY